MNKSFLPYDVYERHKRVAESISEGETLLDVGGELNHLSQFAKGKKITVANLTTGDVIIKKNKLPFRERSFENVCSIDVLEHIPKNARQKFINDLIRISKNRIVLSFPIGTPEHVEKEKKMHAYLKFKNLDVTYLNEHIKNGLPTKTEIENLTKTQKVHINYSGSILISEYLFKLFIYDPKIKYIRKIIYFLKLTFYMLSNPLLYLLLSNKKYSKTVNRAYLIIYK